MKIAISYRHIEFPEPVEAAVNRHLQKIGTLLKSYAPDLVQVHGTFDKNPRNNGFAFSLNLTLPTGTLHATGKAPDARASARKGFVELEAQIKKHQGRLRKDHEWKRKRSRAEQLPA
jgi:ribosome-associated translation inhibitor RaiA